MRARSVDLIGSCWNNGDGHIFVYACYSCPDRDSTTTTIYSNDRGKCRKRILRCEGYYTTAANGLTNSTNFTVPYSLPTILQWKISIYTSAINGTLRACRAHHYSLNNTQ